MEGSAAAGWPGTPARPPHLIDAHLLPEGDGAGLRPDLRAVRAARPLLDRLERPARASLAAVVTYGGVLAPDEARASSETLARALALGACLALPCADGLFGALHLVGALLRGLRGERVLVVGGDDPAAAFLLARDGGVRCLPLPPTRPGRPDGGVAAAHGIALAASLAAGGVHARDVARWEAAGASRAEASGVARQAGLTRAASGTRPPSPEGMSAEALLAGAALSPPARATLLWRYGDGVLEGCLLGGA